MRKPKNKINIWLKIAAYAVSLAILLYAIFINWLPFVYTKTYTLDIGSENDMDSSGKFYLLSPSSALSSIQRYNDQIFRQIITNGPITFKFNPPIEINNNTDVRFGLEIEPTAYIEIKVLNDLKNKTEWAIFYDSKWAKYSNITNFEDLTVYASPDFTKKKCGKTIKNCFSSPSISRIDYWLILNIPKGSSLLQGDSPEIGPLVNSRYYKAARKNPDILIKSSQDSLVYFGTEEGNFIQKGN